jgi:hypothetical protein
MHPDAIHRGSIFGVLEEDEINGAVIREVLREHNSTELAFSFGGTSTVAWEFAMLTSSKIQ